MIGYRVLADGALTAWAVLRSIDGSAILEAMSRRRWGSRQLGRTEQFVTDLYESHATDLFRWFERKTWSPQVAGDLTAETFAQAIRSASQYNHRLGDPGAWLWGIARHLLHSYFRTAAVEREAMRRLQLVAPVPDDSVSDVVVASVSGYKDRERLDGALSRLSDGVSKAVRMRILDQRSYDEVADACGCSEGAARVRVSRGLAALALDLHQEGALDDE